MAGYSSIEWTEVTWNPVTGCSKVSPGCKHCYAERLAKRLKAMGVHQYRNGFKVTLAPGVLEQPLRWRKSRLVFVNSMSDLFHEAVSLAYIKRVFQVMANTPQHTYQILTKRAERLAEISPALSWEPNIWMGVSIENSEALHRLDGLRICDAKVKFISAEPLLGPMPGLSLRGVDWVIVGGESGPRARPLLVEWIEQIRSACICTGVPFFFKQWGRREYNSDPNDPTMQKTHPFYAKGGCQLNGRVIREIPGKGLISA